MKELLSKFKKFKVQAILVLGYKKNGHKVIHSRAKLIARDLHIQETFEFMHQSVVTKIKNSANDWV